MVSDLKKYGEVINEDGWELLQQDYTLCILESDFVLILA
jgi:hypothetical protein